MPSVQNRSFVCNELIHSNWFFIALSGKVSLQTLIIDGVAKRLAQFPKLF